jgi:hypothetical protein
MSDLALGPDGDLEVPGRFVSDRDQVVQRIRLRLGLFRGEYLLDGSKGLDFVEWRRFKRKPLKEILSVVRREIDTIPGVLRTEDPSIVDTGAAVRISLTVVTPEDGSFRVLIDEFGQGFGSTGGANRSGADPATTPGSTLPIVIIGGP